MAVPALSSRIDRSDDRFRQNVEAFDSLVTDLREELAVVRLGGPASSRERHVARGKLLPRDRVDALLDPGSPFEQKPFLPGQLATKVREMLDRRVTPLREMTRP